MNNFDIISNANTTNSDCIKGHKTEKKVCQECYDELLKKYNQLIGKGKTAKQKSIWHTW